MKVNILNGSLICHRRIEAVNKVLTIHKKFCLVFEKAQGSIKRSWVYALENYKVHCHHLIFLIQEISYKDFWEKW